MESLNSCTIVELCLDEIPSTSGGDSQMPLLPSPKVSSFHEIFNLNGILIATRFDKGGYGKVAFHTVKNMFNDPYSAFFLESFDDLRGEDQYLLGFVLPDL